MRNFPPVFLLSLLYLVVVVSCGQPINSEKSLSAESTSEEQQVSKEDSVPTACPEIYQPVCGQPPMPKCPEGMNCPQVMPQPKTYSNDCKRKQAKASHIQEGECPETTL